MSDTLNIPAVFPRREGLSPILGTFNRLKSTMTSVLRKTITFPQRKLIDRNTPQNERYKQRVRKYNRLNTVTKYDLLKAAESGEFEVPQW